MVKINRIYTRTGDDGTTGLVGGGRERKDGPRVNALGEIDELNAWIGLSLTLSQEHAYAALSDKLTMIQNELFDIGAEVATPADAAYPGMLIASAAQATRLEQWIDEISEGIPELRSFVLPGGSALNSYLHLARTVCRRAERTIVNLMQSTQLNQNILVYLNRLSDLLFAMARYESSRAGRAEYLWIPGKSRNS